MNDPRVNRLARLLVDYSVAVRPGDRVLIEAATPAEPLVRALFERILRAGGHPHLAISFGGLDTMTGLDATFIQHASEKQLAHPPAFMELAYEEFEGRIRVHSSDNTNRLSNQAADKIRRRREALRPILEAQFERGRSDDFRWVTTLFPTHAYAQAAEMSLTEYESFVYSACRVEGEQDPVAHWKSVQQEQEKAIAAIDGGDRVELKGPNCDLELSVAGRTFKNACGRNNMPDGEIFTSPVEDSVNGWVKFTYPALYQGRTVLGAQLEFEAGKVVNATAERGEDFLRSILDTDEGSRYVGEFAIGTNRNIDQFTGNILFDEKIGGSFHMALGAGYPETGSQNKSAIHWDLICDLQSDSEIRVDGELFYKDGEFRY
ncbi:MAG: aminopeptidase [Anaerolineales bacterium]|nr:aminopeptidase [Anaerolineales bacterium]